MQNDASGSGPAGSDGSGGNGPPGMADVDTGPEPVTAKPRTRVRAVTARELQVIPGQGTGGPLVNLSGQVIGITLAGSPGGAHGTSFAMPINEALTIARQLKH